MEPTEKDKFYASINPSYDGCSNWIVFFILVGLMMKACNCAPVNKIRGIKEDIITHINE